MNEKEKKNCQTLHLLHQLTNNLLKFFCKLHRLEYILDTILPLCVPRRTR